jgi:hypothetical protein
MAENLLVLIFNKFLLSMESIKNWQSSAICERMHQTAGNIICTLTHAYPPANMQVANQVVDSALATTMYVL